MASGLILIPLYMANLTTDLFGALVIYMAFSMLIQLLVTYSFDTSLYIHYHEFKDRPKVLSSFISSAFVMMLLIGTGIAILLYLFGGLIFAVVFEKENVAFYPFGWLALGGGTFQALFKVHSNLLQSREKPETFFWANAGLFTCIVTFTVVGLEVFPKSLIGPLGGRLVALALGGTWVLYRIFRAYGFHFDFRLLSSSFSFNLYAFIYQLQQWVINYFDRILMGYYLSLSLVGVYGFTVSCLIGIEILMNGLHSSFYPKVVKEVMAQADKGSSITINRYYYGLVAIIMMVVCSAILILPFLVEWLATYSGKLEYMEAIVFIPYIASFYLLKSLRLYFSAPFGILKYTKPLPVIYAVAVVVKIVGMILLMNQFTIMGVIIASLLSMVIEIVLLHASIKDQFAFSFNAFKILVAPLLLMVLILVAESLLPYSAQLLAHVFYCVVCGGILVWVYRLELKQLNPLSIIK